MRVMLRAVMDTERSNEAISSGRMPEIVQSLFDRLDPEAAYFCASQGSRSCTVVFDMRDSSTLPTVVEPLFQELGAKVEIQPAMNREDLQKGLASIQ
ncbi:hypothetical protein HUT06_06075 [Actinomadura sp. NAK00032]|uniref:hypothetical protein n=1 Tax=Actinomadura sp. NAK00032 TaxID=2742128 RepID=UPI001591DF70|nr:hypothetical protein [Actinomadura sp. NAK00032]QKW33652.1 hypothetical protein HUT06_06075 [Actinomadura sp. NAK00032]